MNPRPPHTQRARWPRWGASPIASIDDHDIAVYPTVTQRPLASPVRRWHWCLALLLFGWSFAASGAGFYLPGRGVHPMGRAGASIAGGDTLHTMWYNPANLVEMTGFSVLIDAGVIFSNVDFQRASRIGENGQNVTYDPVFNQAPPIPDPSIMVAYGWKKHRLTIAYGLYAPYATNLKFPDTGAQRYALVDLTGSIFLINHLAVAWAPHPRFRFGAGFQAYTAIVRLLTAASAYLGTFGAPEDRDLDLYTEATINAPFSPTGNAGVWGRILDFDQFKLDAAFSIQLPALMSTNGNIKVRLPTHPLFDPTSIEGSAIQTSLTFPVILRGAIRASFLQRANIEVAFVYEGWSVFDKIALQPKEQILVRNVPTIGDYKLPNISIERGFQDAFSLRVGGSVEAIKGWLHIRAGYGYEKGAIPDRTFSVFLVDSNKHSLGIGLSLTIKKHAIDISYAAHLMQERRITNSEVKQLNPLNPEGTIAVGNGTYNASVHIIGLAWRASF